MFDLIDYKPEHAIELMRSGTTEPLLEISDRTIKWANDMGMHGPCATGVYDGEIIGCGGIWIIWPGRGEAWVCYKFDIGKYHINPAIAKNWMDRMIAEHNIARLETALKSDFPKGILYAEWMGFKFEGRKAKYHADGTDALEYVIIKGD